MIEVPETLMGVDFGYLELTLLVSTGSLAFGFLTTLSDGVMAERFILPSESEQRVVVRIPEVEGALRLVLRAGPDPEIVDGYVRNIRAVRDVDERAYTWQRGSRLFGRDRSDVGAEQWLEILREKWEEIPVTAQERDGSAQLSSLSDDELLARFEAAWSTTTAGPDGFSIRGWYHELYRDALAGKRVLEVGSGVGVDTVFLAGAGASVVCLDLVATNLRVIQRLADIKGLAGSVETVHLSSMESLATLDGPFDIIWAIGSLITVPFEIAILETQALLQHLRPGGRWVELCYPKVRWEREGSLPLDVWGDRTDGIGTPWMEWYDLEKIMARFSPVDVDVVLALDFHNADFNWFDLRIEQPFLESDR